MIIFDGLGDRPAPSLAGMTPLEAATTPHLDRFARESITGLMHAKQPGYPLGSPLALHLMFGYPEPEFPDRGPLLAIARGVSQGPNEVAMAARFAVSDSEPGRLMLRERFVRDREETCRSLASAVAEFATDGIRFRYQYTGRGDGLLFVSGTGVSHEITDSDPLGLDLPVLRVHARSDAHDRPAAERTAAALNAYLRWSHGVLRAHPSNAGVPAAIDAMITKWAGPAPSLERFEERWGMRAASLPDEEVVTGLMCELGFHIEQVPDDGPEPALRARLARAQELFRDGFEFVHLHVKYPDPIAHRQEPAAVRDAIAGLDRAMAWYWEVLAADEDLLTVLTADHTTPSTWRGWPSGRFNDQHGGEPAPLAIRGGNVRVDAVATFAERAMAGGGLGLVTGPDFMPVVLNAAERTNMWEMRPTPVHRLFRPSAGTLDALDP